MIGMKILMVIAVAELCFIATRYPTPFHEPQTPYGGHTCPDSTFYFFQQHCSHLWPWRQRETRKFPSISTCRPPVPMATTATLPMPALPPAITGRAISITAFSLEWAHGPTGATVTAGAAIVSPTTVVEGITAVAVVRHIVDLQAAHQMDTQANRESPTLNPPQQRTVAHRMLHPTRRQRMVAHPMLHPTRRHRIVAANLTVTVGLMVGRIP